MSINIPISKRQLVAVEHPCHVQDAERAIDMLGGVRAIATASRDGTAFLECHLRPNDPLSHPLFGELVRTPALLLKVRRRKRTVNAGGGRGEEGPTSSALSAEVIGTVRHSYRFAGLADFQYVSSPQARGQSKRHGMRAPTRAAPNPHATNTADARRAWRAAHHRTSCGCCGHCE